jgi:transposase
VPLERLREACGVSRDGSKASNILKAARQFGLTAKGFRKEPATLHELPMPSIIHWNFNHFVVLERLDSDYAYVNDPSVGRRKVGHDEFDAAFTGVVLAMEPGPDFKPGGREPDFFPLLLRRLSHSFWAVLLLVALSMALVVPTILVPTFTKIFVDDVLIKHVEGWFTPLLIGMAISAVARALMTAFQQSLLLRIQTKLTVSMVSQLLWHVLTLPMEFFTQRHSGDLANRVAASEQIAQLLSNGVAANALNLISVIFIARAELESLTTRRKTAQGLALRARIVLTCAEGGQNTEVAANLGLDWRTVGKWRRRFVERRVDGLHDEPRSGAPRTIDDARIEAVIVKTLENCPENATHWSSRGMAQASGLSVSTVQRIPVLRRIFPLTLSSEFCKKGPSRSDF